MLVLGDHRHRGGPAAAPDSGFVCYVVPVDRCYELVGIVRAHWVGLAGGVEVWSRIDAFFDDLATRSRPVTREG